jgi:penicillin-binding protein 1C
VIAPIGGAVLLFLAAAVSDHAPPFEDVRAAWRSSDRQLLDRWGDVLHELRVDSTRRRLAWTPLADISPALRAAVLRSEDRRFFEHRGVDPRAVGAALLSRLRGRPPRGASTISMQVAALLDADLRRRAGPRTLGQKWRQVTRALALEARWSKRAILEAYLNLVTFRGELEGVSAAAALLYGKAPHGLGDAEAAVMAALLSAPAARVEAVVRRASALGTAPREAIVAAALRALGSPGGRASHVADAPHLAARLLRGAGMGTAAAPAAVTSTLDGATQREAIQSLRQQLLGIRGERVNDGAVLVVDNASGDVLAYVGSSGELSTASHVDGVVARRQPGSALKPFLYGLAFDRRVLTPASTLDDTPLEVPVDGGVYRPSNYDDRYHGPVSARTALASSLNVPAVRVLGLVGADAFVQHLRALGFDGVSESGDFYGPALALGSADVTLWQLVNAVRALANDGVWTPLRTRPTDPVALPSRRVYPTAVAFLVADVLADRESRSATFGLENALATPFWTAVKTGTSKDMRDNWCVGFSRRYTVGVWVGNFTGEPMRNVSGVTGAAPVWRELMTWLHRQTPSRPPRIPDGLVVRTVEVPHDPEASRAEWFLRGTEPEAPVVRAVARARIATPVAGTIIAIDPDIPDTHQRVMFEAHVERAGTRWVLNGADLGPATRPVLWRPTPGRHALALHDAHGAVRDRVTFVVRGTPAR